MPYPFENAEVVYRLRQENESQAQEIEELRAELARLRGEELPPAID